jgi:hypothetical protein
MLDYTQKINGSLLAQTQKMHALKTFVIPKWHYARTNHKIKLECLRRVDLAIRNTINDAIKGPALPLDFINASYKDGGLGVNKCENEYPTDKIGHGVPLMKIEHGRNY